MSIEKPKRTENNLTEEIAVKIDVYMPVQNKSKISSKHSSPK